MAPLWGSGLALLCALVTCSGSIITYNGSAESVHCTHEIFALSVITQELGWLANEEENCVRSAFEGVSVVDNVDNVVVEIFVRQGVSWSSLHWYWDRVS